MGRVQFECCDKEPGAVLTPRVSEITGGRGVVTVARTLKPNNTLSTRTLFTPLETEQALFLQTRSPHGGA